MGSKTFDYIFNTNVKWYADLIQELEEEPKWKIGGNANSKPKVKAKARADSKMHKLPT